jgi:signal transduction histidine kinase
MSTSPPLQRPESEHPVPRALVVDDDDVLLRVHARCLIDHGYDVVTARDAESALRALRSTSFDVIVSDIQMPAMSGIELVAEMRARGVEVPVVLVTGNPHLDTATKAVEYGVLRYLSKPVTPRDLVRVVAEALRLHGLARAKRLALDNAALRSLVEELGRAKTTAQAASRAKSEFLSKMTHELRTPLTAVIGFTNLVLDTELTCEQREYVTRVETAAASLLAVIQDILDLADLDRGTIRLDATSFNLRETFTDALRPLAARAEAKGLTLTVEIDPAVPEALEGDPLRLRQIIGQLVGNAIKFTASGEVRVCVSLELKSTREARVRVSVADTGIGIPETKQASIFEPFSQGDNSSTRHYGGAGLGLSISQQLATLMGGALHVQSTPGLGATFYFTARFERVAAETKGTCRLRDDAQGSGAPANE